MDSPATIEISADVLRLIPKEVARNFGVLPIRCDSRGLHVLASKGFKQNLLGDLAFLTGKNIVLEPVSSELLTEAIARYYGAAEESVLRPQQGVIESSEGNIATSDDQEMDFGDGSAVSTASRIISDAIRMGASDIHVEPYEESLRVRFRLDGVLKEMFRPPLEMSKALISRLKIMADLDIAEKRRPQDGRIRVKEGERMIDIRVSCLPTDFGEKIVLRILDKTQLRLDLASLGFCETDLRLFEQTIRLPYGMVLVTGPTGSGKTTTLYAALNSINRPEVNITTIEDPIEYNLAGINQTQVHSDIGLTFAAVLRSILRQDPNVIMVGEIRDAETAQIAIRASLTGHLVFSTLHTNDAPSALTRLVDMGVEPFLVASSVKMILAQRLLRKVCPDCAEAYRPSPDECEDLLHAPEGQRGPFLKGRGCRTCNQTGYKGRFAVYEVLSVGNGLADLIAKGALASEIRQSAKGHGMKTLREAALEAARLGITTVDEVLRETAE